ncbi:hypothetical protein IKD82_01820 [Candidatus Saccharibacteria bacterium]|nr:hypothetical protein [Candidatus Saccharibacteria bacterium]
MITYADTNEINNITKDLSPLINDLESEFNSLFKRLSNVPTITKEWVGNQATFYFSKTSEDKLVYSTLINELRSFVQELNSESINLDHQIQANNSEK